MANDRILQNEIARLGQSQADRSPAALEGWRKPLLHDALVAKLPDA